LKASKGKEENVQGVVFVETKSASTKRKGENTKRIKKRRKLKRKRGMTQRLSSAC